MSAYLRKRLAELDAQIVEQRRVLAELDQTRSDVERELRATAYPVLTLPVEITTEIFLHCRQVLGSPEFDPLPTINQNTTPIDLASVCRVWRDISLATPKLWSELDVRFDNIPDELVSQPRMVESCIDRWLTRAGACPLTLHIECYKQKGFTLSRLRDIIHRWSHQVQYFYLEIGSRDIGSLELDSVPFPLLQSVKLGCTYNPDAHPPPSVFAEAPQFHDLCLLSEMHIPLGFSLPWLQLTKFEGTLLDLSLFTLAPNLREAICFFDPGDGDLSVITHLNLRSLTTQEDSGTDILEYLTLPGLQELQLSYLPSHHSLVDFLSRSSPPLISFSFPGAQTGTSFNDWGKCLPSTLQSLEICTASADSLVDSSILDALPNLRTLIFKNVTGGFDFHFLVEYLYLRSKQLRTFKLIWQDNPFLDGQTYGGSPGSIRRYDTNSGHLSQLAQSGMDIYLGTEDKSYFPIGYVFFGWTA